MLPDTCQNESKIARTLVVGVRNVLDQLPRPLFRIGIDEEVAVQRLLLGVRPSNRSASEALADLLACVGPVLCKSPEQQSVFQAIAERQAQTVTDCRQEALRPEPSSVATAAEALPATTGAHLAGDPEADRAVEQQIREKKRSTTLRVIIIVLLFAIGMAFVAFMAVSQDPSSKVPVTTQDKGKDASPSRWASLKDLLGKGVVLPHGMVPIGRLALAFLPLVTAGLIIAHRRRLTRYLERGKSGALPTEEDAIRIAGSVSDIFGAGTRRRLLCLRTRFERPSCHLNIPATLRATIEAGGRFILKFATRSLSCEYLLITRKLTDQAHLYHIGSALAAVMRKEEMHVRHYTFWREGVRLVEVRDFGSDGAPDRNIQELSSLQSRFPDHRLIVLDEARYLIGRRGGIAEWAEQLRAWPEKIWLTPLDRSRWGAGEAAAHELGFTLVPLTAPDCLASLGGAFAGVSASFDPGLYSEEEGMYPQSLYRRSNEFSLLDPPSRNAVATLLEEMKAYLGASAYYWLQACAVFPMLEPQLTIHLGMHLRDDLGVPLFTLPRLAFLSRLPWFKTGEMPDWLREALVDNMPDTWRERVRETVIQILAPSTSDGGEPSIEVIRRYRRRLVDTIAEKFRAQPAPDQIRSRLLIDFLQHRRTLSFGLPLWLFRGWREVCTPDALAIGILGVLSSLLMFTLYIPFTRGITGWMSPLFAEFGHSGITMILDAINLFGLYLIWTWAKDVVAGHDARLKARRKVLAFSGLEFVATLFPVLVWLCASASAPLAGKVKQNPVDVLYPNTDILFLTILLSLCASVLRAAVSPCLAKRIAVVPLAEAIGRTPFWKLLAWFGRALVLGSGPAVVLWWLASQHVFGDLMQVNWPYLFAMFGWHNDFFPVVRPILTLPVLALLLGAILKSLLGNWRATIELAAAAFLGALIAEILIARLQMAGLVAGASMGMWLPAFLVPTLAATALALSLVRRQETASRKWWWFGAAAALSNGVLVFAGYQATFLVKILGSQWENFAITIFLLAMLMMPLLMVLAGFGIMRAGGVRLPMLRSLGHALLSQMVQLLFCALYISFLVVVDFMDVPRQSRDFMFTLVSFLAGGCIWFSFLVWLRLVMAPPRTPSPNWPAVRSAVPWLLIPLLLAITFRLRATEFLTINFSGLFLPLAIFMGLRYRRSGFIAFVAGAWPLVVGYYAGWADSLNHTSSFVICLTCCFAVGNHEWLSGQIKRLRLIRQRGILAFMLVLPFYFFLYPTDFLEIGFSGIELAVMVAFLCGAVRQDGYRLAAVLSVVALVAKTAYLMGVPLRLKPGPLSIGYGLDSLYDILSLWASIWLGRCLGDLVAGYSGFNAAQAEPADSEAAELFSSPGKRLLAILAAIGAGAHIRERNFWHALTPAFKDLPSRSLVPVFAAHALFCAILFLAYQDIRLEIIMKSFEKDFYEAIDVMVTVAYLASLLAGAVLGRWSLLTIALVGVVIAFLEPLLLTVPTTVLFQISGATLSIKVQPLHYVCEFLSCMGFSWLGIYLSTMARKTAMPIASESSKNQKKVFAMGETV